MAWWQWLLAVVAVIASAIAVYFGWQLYQGRPRGPFHLGTSKARCLNDDGTERNE